MGRDVKAEVIDADPQAGIKPADIARPPDNVSIPVSYTHLVFLRKHVSTNPSKIIKTAIVTLPVETQIVDQKGSKKANKISLLQVMHSFLN